MQKAGAINAKTDAIPPTACLAGLISGLYAPPLWAALRARAGSTESLGKLRRAVAALHSQGDAMAAFDLITALYELAGLDVPEAIAGLAERPGGAALFVDRFIADSGKVLSGYCDPHAI